MSILVEYNGLYVVSPDPSGDGGLAINNNFKTLATRISHSGDGPPTSYDPTGTDVYAPGSRWFNASIGEEWICTEVTVINPTTSNLTWIQALPYGTINFSADNFLRISRLIYDDEYLIWGPMAGGYPVGFRSSTNSGAIDFITRDTDADTGFFKATIGSDYFFGLHLEDGFTGNAPSFGFQLSNYFNVTLGSGSGYIDLTTSYLSSMTTGNMSLIAGSSSIGFFKVTTPNTFLMMDNDVHAILMKNCNVGGDVKVESVGGYISLGARNSSDDGDLGRMAIDSAGNIKFTGVRGLILPKFTETQKDGMSSPEEGMILYDTTNKKVCYFDGTDWVDL